MYEEENKKKPTLKDMFELNKMLSKLEEIQSVVELFKSGKISEDEVKQRFDEIRDKEVDVDIHPRPIEKLLFPHCEN